VLGVWLTGVGGGSRLPEQRYADPKPRRETLHARVVRLPGWQHVPWPLSALDALIWPSGAYRQRQDRNDSLCIIQPDPAIEAEMAVLGSIGAETLRKRSAERCEWTAHAVDVPAPPKRHAITRSPEEHRLRLRASSSVGRTP
jgi:hypothetical protein